MKSLSHYMHKTILSGLFSLLIHCAALSQEIVVLGVVQDGGYPHIGCIKACCSAVWQHKVPGNNVVSFAVVDTVQHTWWLFEATPDMTRQLQLFREITQEKYTYLPAGIFVTHAHMGHYTGLMYLGREAMNARDIPIYCLPKMGEFLTTNGPWSQLVSLKNIRLAPMQADTPVQLSPTVSVTAFTVPHRDEFSETAGFRIQAGAKKVLFIPDIDKWLKWSRSIVEEVKNVDIALLDATFLSDSELPGRQISEVPHPFVSETTALFQNQNKSVKKKIYFIHFNHTNPLLRDEDAQTKLRIQGFNQAFLKQRL